MAKKEKGKKKNQILRQILALKLYVFQLVVEAGKY
jgi:hypothetical protein